MDRKQKTKYIAMALCVALLFQAVNPVGLSALVNDEMQEQGTEEMQEESSAVESETAESEKNSSSEESGSAEEDSSSDETKPVEESNSVEGSSVEDSLSNESSVSEESSEAVESSSIIKESSEEISEKEETESETETENESEILELDADETGEPDIEGFVEAVVQGLKNRDAIIENLEQYNIPNATAEEMYYGIINDNPDLYYVKPGSFYGPGEPIHSIYVDYYDDVDNDDGYWQGKQNVLSIVTSDMTDIQKAIVLHDWIVTHTDYDHDSADRHLNNKAHSAYGVFAEGLAVCQGMSLAYKSLLDELNIENYIVEGKSGGGPHAWNVLVIDGEYYHVDITQDNSDTSDALYPRIGHDAFLVNNNNGVFSFTHTDYYMHKNYTKMDVPATSTIYDNAFWQSVSSPITAANGSFYYIKNNKLYKTSSYDNSSESIKITDVKTISESSTPYSGLFRMNDRIYFNDKYAVYSIALDGSDKRAEYQITDTLNGYIGNVDRTGNQVYIELYKDGTFTKSDISLAGGNIKLQPMEIGFENSEEEVYENDTLQLNLKTYPGGDISSITWTSDNTAVATVSDSGLVTPVTTGTAKITAEWNSMKAECTVTVKESGGSSEEQHYVIFREPNGDFISSCYVNDGCDAPLPDFSAPDGYSLSWTENYINIKKNETVMAIFTPIEYDITYELDGGINNTANPPKYTIETEDIILASPTKDKSTFSGWYYDSKCTIKVDIISKGSYGDITLYAKWITESSNKYLVTFKAPDGTVLKEEQVTEGCDASLPEYSAPNGYNITWNGNYTNVRQDETVTAVLTPIVYNITYELDGGTNAAANPSTYTVEAEDITFASPTKNGMTFDGWYYDHEYTIRVDILAKGSYGNITLYAKWTTESSNKYLVIFKAPDGTVLKEEQVTEGHDATLPEYSAPNGYSITWNGNYINIRQNETVTAVLIPIEYNIIYELDGGTNAADNPSKYTIETENITLVSPTKDGMTFDGWYYESSFTTKIDIISKGSYGDITLYAKWIAESSNKYLVTFKALDGTVLKEEQVTEGHDATLPDYKAPNGYSITWNGNYTNVRQDETVTAVLIPIEYNITYELDGGTNAAGNPSKYTIETDNIVLANPTKDGMIFDGWYYDSGFVTKVDVISKGSYGDITLYAKWFGKDPEDNPEYKNGLWTEKINDVYYTGSAIKPVPVVYDGMTRLASGKDYFVAYKNNTNAGTAQVIITGKGNYKGKVTAEFKIIPVDIKTASVYDMSVMYKSGKKQTPVPVVELNGKKLKNKKDFSVAYQGSCIEPGEYDVTISGTGNYTGTRQIKLVIASGSEMLISKASVSKIPDITYTGNPVVINESSVTVKYKGKVLENGTDYEIQYGTCIDSGSYDLFIIGKGQYKGVKAVKFNIKGTDIKKASMSSLTVPYTGTAQTPDLGLTFEGKKLVNGTDYTVTFENNINKGTAKAKITGKGRFSGTVTKTFKITAQPISAAEISFNDNSNSFPYVKGGTIPEITVKCNGNVLKKGVDYTVTGKNNQKAGNATLVVKGIGNYSGTVNKSFAVTTQDIANVLLMIPDVEYTGKKGGYKTKPILMDISGKKLSTSDYDKNIVYKDAEGNVLDKNSVANAGGIVSVTIKGKGNYSGEITGTYRIIPKGRSIAKAKQNKIVKEYTGKEITLLKEEISLSIGGNKIPSDGFEIIPGSYVNNVNKGTASVTVRGVGEYGGIKTITFKIDMQNLKWGK